MVLYFFALKFQIWFFRQNNLCSALVAKNAKYLIEKGALLLTSQAAWGEKKVSHLSTKRVGSSINAKHVD